MSPILVLLADDHALVRAGLRSLVENISGVKVVAEAGDGREAVKLTERVRPDIVLMDIAMSGLNGLEAAEQILKSDQPAKIIILSMHSTEEYVTKALHIGVSGYLIKDAAASELELALHVVCRGEKYLSPAISTRLPDKFNQHKILPHGGPESLTPRQREVLQLIAEGYTTKEIAVMLDMSQKTAESHRTNLMERLNIHDVAGLVRYAIRSGLISPLK
ncbi:MAG: response regulator transcription factor [Ignavibacteriales bacterium]|nr:response regulator transcription factor [Ignavibacteriales bacterium]